MLLCPFVNFVTCLRFGNGLQKLGTRGSNHVLVVETCLNELSDRRCLGIKSVLNLAGLLHVEVEDLVLDHLGVLAFKWIALVEDVVDAAPKGPDVDLLAEDTFLKDEFRCRIIDMTAKVTAPQQLLECVRQPNSVKFHDSALELLNPTWMHVSVNVVLRVHVVESLNYLIEDG